jgi:hypothetical protein
VLDRGKAAQVRADFRQYLDHHRQAKPVDACEIDARPVGQYLANVKCLALLAPRARCLAQIDLLLAQIVQLRVQP